MKKLLFGLMLATAMVGSVNATIGSSHTCSSSDGEYTIDFIFGPSTSLYRKGSDKAVPYKIKSKLLIEETISNCKSVNSTKMLSYKITEERYLIRIETADSKMFLYCEAYSDPSPAAACDSNEHDKIIYHKKIGEE
jgi:hypothetical protein